MQGPVIDGREVKSGDRLAVTWPDGFSEVVSVDVIPVIYDGGNQLIEMFTRHDYHGMQLAIPLTGHTRSVSWPG